MQELVYFVFIAVTPPLRHNAATLYSNQRRKKQERSYDEFSTMRVAALLK